jgi:tetratricopeptide (TPR) repeat protein
MSRALSVEKSSLIPSELVVSLNADADCRRINSGTARISQCGHILEQFHPSAQNATAFLATFARWCDVGDDGPEPVRKLLATFDEDVRSRLSVAEYVRVRMAEGMVAMKTGTLDKAIEDFEIVLKLAEGASAGEVLALSNYWMGRCLRTKGDYERALIHIRKGRAIQLERGHIHCSAAMRVLEGLILVEKGEPKEALQHLRAAEAVLAQTDDFITLGNIQSTYGRILQREARYRQAIQHFTRAIEQFQKRDPKHPNVARAELDVASARILVIRHLRRNIDGYREQQPSGERRPARAVLVKEFSSLCEEALQDLNRATLIYEQNPNVRGIARVHLCRAYLHQVVGELDLAFQKAANAYVVAESKRDIILMASARNLQGMVVEEATLDGEIIEACADHALAAQDYAGEAVELASHTQDRRLLAWAHTWYGLTLSSTFANTWDQAREEMDLAAEYLEPSVRDYIWEDFQILKKRLLKTTTLDSKLIQWARGDIGGKTFRQLEEDFADLIIPIAWRQEGQRISRVAARLSISPRKVRRVLARLKYLETELVHDEDFTESPEDLGSNDPEERVRPVLVEKNRKLKRLSFAAGGNAPDASSAGALVGARLR